MTYTTSFAFFEAIWEAGITHVFVNLGTDHPSLIEAFVKGQKEKPNDFPRIITCPNEMVALAMADGYARLTNKPQCVLVHVDVGTQNLGAAVHDASMGRCPVLIFAGLSPYTIEGEHKGSRNEYIHWIQDVPDQKAIVSQYCRYAGEIKTGRNVKQIVNRALQFATSNPQGPVYLCGAREVMEAELDPYELVQAYWTPVAPSALPQSGVETIANALIQASEPLLITGYSGRNHNSVAELVKLATTIKGLRVLDCGGSDMCFPADHPGWLGLRYGVDKSIETADVILVVDADTPWIPTRCKPSPLATIFHIDVDPLKQLMPVFYLNAVARYRSDAFTAISQLNGYIASSPSLLQSCNDGAHEQRWEALKKSHIAMHESITALATPESDGTFGAAYLMSRVKAFCPPDTIWVVEAVTTTAPIADQIRASLPGSYINCGGGGLGWSGGGALGVKLASISKDWKGFDKSAVNGTATSNGDSSGGPAAPSSFVCQIVGDGTYLFSVPSSVYWISSRYSLPILTIVINNAGWHAPRRSTLLMHPDGYSSKATPGEMGVSFAPAPDYAGIAKAAAGGRIYAGRAWEMDSLDKELAEAVRCVRGGVGAVVDAQIDGGEGKFAGGRDARIDVASGSA